MQDSFGVSQVSLTDSVDVEEAGTKLQRPTDFRREPEPILTGRVNHIPKPMQDLSRTDIGFFFR
jgi:hypothetical protein